MVKLFAVQMVIRDGYPEDNLKHLQSIFDDSDFVDGDIVCLPELINTGYDWNCIAKLTELDSRNFTRKVSALALKRKVWLIAGSIAEVIGDSKYNTAYVFAPDGSILGMYRKIHLFLPINETRYFRSGSTITSLPCYDAKVGLGICFDLRFPELFRKLALIGSTIFILPAAWPSIRKEAWQTLIKARAIENQCYCVGCNRGGFDLDNNEYGFSLIVDPFGNVLAESNGSNNDLLSAEYDLTIINKSRLFVRSFKERRPDIYRLDFEIAQNTILNEFNEM